MSNYKKLKVWEKADELAFKIYKLTEDFPRYELFGIILQLRRAVLSIPTYIVEGYNWKSKRELFRFIDIALGSLAETEYLLEFSKKMGYIKKDVKEIEDLIEEVGKLLWSFQKVLWLQHFSSSALCVFQPTYKDW